ncbi:MAG: hypothetical protein KatS3mg085_227 [Candidatus Dojkabacteria bacterium]|nr:MAG: hypothetical protein KatS3mg085_227 [Candidatus Dojkabacteria bacterium]
MQTNPAENYLINNQLEISLEDFEKCLLLPFIVEILRKEKGQSDIDLLKNFISKKGGMTLPPLLSKPILFLLRQRGLEIDYMHDESLSIFTPNNIENNIERDTAVLKELIYLGNKIKGFLEKIFLYDKLVEESFNNTILNICIELFFDRPEEYTQETSGAESILSNSRHDSSVLSFLLK